MDARETLTISLPAMLRQQIDEIVRTGGYGNTSEYVRELVRQDVKQRAKELLEQKLLEGLQSGPGIGVTAEYWSDLRRRLADKARSDTPPHDA